MRLFCWHIAAYYPTILLRYLRYSVLQAGARSGGDRSLALTKAVFLPNPPTSTM